MNAHTQEAIGAYRVSTNAGTETLAPSNTSHTTGNTLGGDTLTISGTLGAADVSYAAAASAREIAELANGFSGQTGVMARARTVGILSSLSADDTVSFDLFGINNNAVTISATVTTTDLSALAESINSEVSTTGISAEVSEDKRSIELISATGEDVVIENFATLTHATTIDLDAGDFGGHPIDFDDDGTADTTPLIIADGDDATVIGVVRFDSSASFTITPGSTELFDDVVEGEIQGAILGTTGDDQLSGTIAQDTIEGLGGNDALTGLGSGDLLDGGFGNDWLSGAGGFDHLVGGFGADTLQGGMGRDTLAGGDGGDWMLGDAGKDKLIGGAGADTLAGSTGDDTLMGGEGDDTFPDTYGINSILGGPGNDSVSYSSSSASVQDGELLRGGTGDDALSLSWSLGAGSFVFSIPDNLDHAVTLADGARVSGFERLSVSIYSSGAGHGATIAGGAFDDSFFVASSGPALLEGHGGNDGLTSGIKDDVLLGGSGNDTLSASLGNNTLKGGAGDDTLVTSGTVFVLDGGDGVDFASLSLYSETAGFTLSVLESQHHSLLLGNGSVIARIEQISVTGSNTAGDLLAGGAFADTLSGAGGDDTLIGGGAIDLLFGGAGADSLSGGQDNDFLDGYLGSDTLAGGAGDEVYQIDAEDVVVEFAGGGTDTVLCPLTSYSYRLPSHVENLSFYNTRSTQVREGLGNEESNVISGNRSGPNHLFGFRGDDTLSGGVRHDLLVGGGGNDTFHFESMNAASAAPDSVRDFTPGEDVLRLNPSVFAPLGSAGQLDPAKFQSGAGVVAAVDADDRLIYDTSTGTLYYDPDGSLSVYSSRAIAVFGFATHPGITAGDIQIGS